MTALKGLATNVVRPTADGEKLCFPVVMRAHQDPVLLTVPRYVFRTRLGRWFACWARSSHRARETP